jgi:hypothetical protein
MRIIKKWRKGKTRIKRKKGIRKLRTNKWDEEKMKRKWMRIILKWRKRRGKGRSEPNQN